MKRIIRHLLTMTGAFIFVVHNAHAQLKKPSSSYGLVSNTSATSIIQTVIKWLLSFVGTLAVLMIVIAGIIYITSAGDSGKTDMAKNMLIYAITGLVIAILGYIIVVLIGEGLNGYGGGGYSWWGM